MLQILAALAIARGLVSVQGMSGLNILQVSKALLRSKIDIGKLRFMQIKNESASEAAMAYDSAAMCIRTRNSHINFPITITTSKE